MALWRLMMMASSASFLGVALASEGGLRNASFANDTGVLAANNSVVAGFAAENAFAAFTNVTDDPTYVVCVEMCTKSGFCGNNADGTFCNQVASCQQGCFYAAQGKRISAQPDECKALCGAADDAGCTYKSKYDSNAYNMCSACPGSQANGGRGMGSCLQWPEGKTDCPTGCRFFKEASGGTYLEMHGTIDECKLGKAPAKTRRLTGALEDRCVSCWDRCQENDLAYPVLRLRGPGVAAVAWNCIGRFEYPTADFGHGGAFSEANGCYQASGTTCNDPYDTDMTWNSGGYSEYSKIGGGHNYCWVDGVQLSAEDAINAPWCHSYSQQQCKEWCESEKCPGVLWRNSGNTCYLKSHASDLDIKPKNGCCSDHHISRCTQAGGAGAVVMCDGGAKNHSAELSAVCKTTLKMYHSLDDCRKGVSAKERLLTGEDDLFCKDCWDRCAESDPGYPVLKLEGPGVAAVAWNCVGKFGTYPSANFARGGVFSAADGCYEAGGGGSVVMCSGEVEHHQNELSHVCRNYNLR